MRYASGLALAICMSAMGSSAFADGVKGPIPAPNHTKCNNPHALGDKPIAPFFRFPALKHPSERMKYLATRNIDALSTDIDSFDFEMRRPSQVIIR